MSDNTTKVYHISAVETREYCFNGTQLRLAYRWNNHSRDFRNKMLAVSKNIPIFRIYNELLDWVPRRGSTLYIHPLCRTKRDLFRNSGYKITINPDKADYIIMPELQQENYITRIADYVVYSPSAQKAYICTVNREDTVEYGFSAQDNALMERQIFCSDEEKFLREIKRCYCSYIPDDPMIEEVINGSQNGRIFCSELKVKFDLPYKIDVDTLDLWSRCSDYHILHSAICNSDWRDYPATVAFVVALTKPYYNNSVFYNSCPSNFKLVLDTIGFNKYRDAWQQLDNKTITPQDWDMLQAYCLHSCGADATGGVMNNYDKSQMYNIFPITSVLPSRLVVKPIKIPQPMPYQNILELF